MDIEGNLNINNNQIESIQSFEKDISNGQINSKLITLFETEISEVFPNILCTSKNEFIGFIETKIKSNLIEQYPNDNISLIFKNKKFTDIFNKNMAILHEKYSLFIKELNESWDNYTKQLLLKEINKEELFFNNFRKHCIKTGKYALHKCSKHKYGEFLSVLHKSSTDGTLSVRYLICTKCKKAYFTSLFLNYCKECDITYYSNKLSNKENSEYQLATYYPPHCNSLFNKKIKCPKCLKYFLYINVNTNKLYCLNKRCNFVCKADNSNWKCDICKISFSTNIKIFNPLEIQNVKDAVKLALLIRKKAHPIKMICCNEIDVYNSVFYHNKNCNGILYLGELDKNSIIICQKCKAINYFKNFIWTCPSCGKRFKENTDNYKKAKKYKKEIKDKNKENDFIKEVNYKKSESDSIIDSHKLIKLNKKSNSKNFEEINEKKMNNMFLNKVKVELRRNGDNYLYEQKTSNNNNGKKKYILSKYLEMQININKNNNSSKEIKANSMSTNKNIILINDNINKKDNSKNNKINNNFNIAYENQNKRNYYKNRFCLKNITTENINNDKSINFKNNLIRKDKNEKKDIIENNKNIGTEQNKNLVYKNPINYKRFYLSKITKNSTDDLKNIGNIKSVNTEEKIKNYKENNNNINNIKPKRFFKKYVSSEIKEDNNKKSKLNFYRSQNIFNVRQKYKNINKKNNLILSNYSQNSNSLTENKNQIEYQSKSVYKNNDENNEKNINDNNQIGGGKLYNIVNYSCEKIGNNKRKYRRFIKDKKEEINEPKKNIIKIDVHDYNEPDNFDKIIVDSNNERSKDSTTECNKSCKKSNKYIDKEDNNRDKEKEENNKDKGHIDRDRDREKEDNVRDKEEINDIINGDNDIIALEKERKEKEEMLKEILMNIEKEEQSKKKPDDIIEITDIIKDSNFQIPILSTSISEEDEVYKNIQNKIKFILSKGKLPLFNIRNYIIRKQIGDGSYGFIYKVIQKDTREEYAIKKIIASDIPTLEEFQREFEIVHENPHPFILDLYGICVNVIDSDNFILYVLMDLADCDWEMEINEYLINHRYYTENQLLSILKQLTSALSYLEKEKNIAHRDIKPENVLVFRSNSINKEDIYKIADFGEAKETKVSKQLNTLRGTELYMSPLLYSGLKEKVDDVKHDPYKSDVFSLGYCLIYAAAMNFNIIYDIRNLQNKFMIKRVLKKYFNKRYSDNFIELVLKMIRFNEEERLDFIELNEILKKEF